ncbi:hypothetical protein HK405_012664 [Cladochytrium tenue]|nr:hypothetical protein HK405_012664 [Cladochytrium tenue]
MYYAVVDAVSPDELSIRTLWLVQAICRACAVPGPGQVLVLQHGDSAASVRLRALRPNATASGGAHAHDAAHAAHHGCEVVVASSDNRPYPVTAHVVTVERTAQPVFLNTVRGMTRFCRPTRGRDFERCSAAWNVVGLSSNEVFRALVAAGVGRRNPILLG